MSATAGLTVAERRALAIGEAVQCAISEARATTRRVASTFALACRLLPGEIRDDVQLLHLVFRTLDDLVDDRRPEARDRVEATAAWAQQRPGARTREVIVLERLAERHPLPHSAIADFCAGMRRTNILRDIDEDAEAARVYIAGETIAQYGSLRPGHRAALVRNQIARADALYEQGLAGLPQLLQGRRAIAAASSMYREILREIERGACGVSPGRAVVSQPRKLAVALQGDMDDVRPGRPSRRLTPARGLLGALAATQIAYGRSRRARSPAATRFVLVLMLAASTAEAMGARGARRGMVTTAVSGLLGFGAELLGVAEAGTPW